MQAQLPSLISNLSTPLHLPAVVAADRAAAERSSLWSVAGVVVVVVAAVAAAPLAMVVLGHPAVVVAVGHLSGRLH